MGAVEMSSPVDLDACRERILALAARYGCRNVRLFGSAARGEATAASDVDILVDVEAGRSLLDLIGFRDEVQNLIGCRVDVVTDRSLSPYLRERIHADARSL